MRVAALVVLVVFGAPAAAREIGVWPLFTWSDDAATGTARLTALGPLVEYRRTPTSREWLVRPLLRLATRTDRRDVEAEVLYPIAAARWREDEWSARVLLFSARHRDAAPDAGGRRTRAALFPLAFYQDAAAGPEVGLLPFYLDLHDTFGWQRVRAIAFPLFVQLEEPRIRRTWAPFPFVSIVDGEDASGLRLFPFWGRTRVGERGDSGFLLWPFVTWDDRPTPDGGVERRRVWFPVLATVDGPDRTVRGWGVAGWLHAVDRRRGTETTGAPWPFVVREGPIGSTAYDVWRVFPLYGRSQGAGTTRRFWLWPAFRTLDQDDETFHFRRRDAMLLAWRSEREWDDATGRSRSLTAVAGLWRSDTLDDRWTGQVPAVVDSIVPRARGVRELWAPLTALVRWDVTPTDASWSVLFDLASRRGGRLRGPWYVDDDPP